MPRLEEWKVIINRTEPNESETIRDEFVIRAENAPHAIHKIMDIMRLTGSYLVADSVNISYAKVNQDASH